MTLLILALTGCPDRADVGTRARPERSTLASLISRSERPPPEPFSEHAGDSEPKDPVPEAFRPDFVQPATPAAAKLLELADSIDRTRTDTAYSHATRVRRSKGVYHFDCSGMMNWMLERVAGKSLADIGRERPVASSYVRAIESAPSSSFKRGWQRVADIDDVRPGDIFAWRRPSSWPAGGNTGHVGVVLGKPEEVPELRDAYVVRILDSTRWPYQYDTRAEGETGFGTGTILIMTDGSGGAIGYGWHGSASRGWNRTDVVFGRLQ